MGNAGERRLIATLADIEPVRRAEREREQALAFVSHDLRAPAGSIVLLAPAQPGRGHGAGRGRDVERAAAAARRRRGPGLSAQQAARLRAGDAGLATGSAQGVGLGLLFVQRVAQRHGGRLRVVPAGRGATLEIEVDPGRT